MLRSWRAGVQSMKSCPNFLISLATARLTLAHVHRAVLGDLLMQRFISPAIASPESYGIVLDTPISNTGRSATVYTSYTVELIN
jgi:hypothetical protein